MPRHDRSPLPLAGMLLLALSLSACGGGGTTAAASPPVVPFDGPTWRLVTDPALEGAVVRIDTYASIGGEPAVRVPVEAGGVIGVPQLLAPKALDLVLVSAALDSTGARWLHGLYTREHLATEQARLSIATEVLFQRMAYLLAAEHDRQAIREELDRRATCMLIEDLDADGAQSARDIALADMAVDGGAFHEAGAYAELRAELERGEGPDVARMLTLSERRSPIEASEATPGTDQHQIPTTHGDLVLVPTGVGATATVVVRRYTPGALVPFVELSRLPTPQAIAVQMRGDVAFVLGRSVLRTWDLADPTTPVLLDSLDFVGETVAGFVLDGSSAYVAAGFGGLLHVNASDPSALSSTVAWDDDSLNSVTVVGDELFAAGSTGNRTLHVFTLDGAARAPGFVRTLAIPNNTYFLVPWNDQAVFAIGVETAQYFEIARGFFDANSTIDIDVAAAAHGVATAGDLLYVSQGSRGVAVLDLSHPFAGRQIDRVELPEEPIWGVTTSSTTLFTASSTRVVAHDRDRQVAPTWDVAFVAEPFASNVLVTDDLAYVPTVSDLHVLDVSSPSAPTRRGCLDLPNTGRGNAMALNGPHLYMGRTLSAMDIVDVSDADGPTYAGSFAIGTIDGMQLRGNTLYVTQGLRFEALDVSSPLAPVSVGEASLLSGRDFNVRGDYAYVPDSFNDGWTRVFDVSDPTAMSLVTSVHRSDGCPGQRPNDVALLGDYAYVSAFNLNSLVGTCLQILDVSTPADPVEVGDVRMFHVNGDDVGVTPGGWVYVTSRDGMQVIDARDVTNPVHRAVVPYRDTGHVQLEGRFAYVSDVSPTGGLHVLKAAWRRVP